MPATRSTPQASRRARRSLSTRIQVAQRHEPLEFEGEEIEEIRYENVIFPADELGAPFKGLYPLKVSDEHEARVEQAEQPHDRRPARLGLKDLKFIRTLGKSLCQVFLVKAQREDHYLDTGHFFALKAIPRKHCRQAPLKAALARALAPDDHAAIRFQLEDHRHEKKAEVGVLAQLDWNPFVLGLYETFYDSVNLYLALEYAPGGTLRTLLRKAPSGMRPSEAVFYFSNIVCALEFLHGNQIVHRDLKPENILVNADGYLCLTDFGSALSIEDRHRHSELGATPGYQAPECILPLADEARLESVDWWAAGCILFEMGTGKMAFFEGRDGPAWPPGPPLGSDFQDLIIGLLHPIAAERIGTKGTKTVQAQKWLADVDWPNMRDRRYLPPYIPSSLGISGLWHRNPLPDEEKVPGLVLNEPPIHLANDDRIPERWAHGQ